MSLIYPFIKLTANYWNLYERIVLTVLNSILVYVLSFNFPLIYNYNLEIIPTVAVLSFFFPEVLSPALTILFIVYLTYTKFNLNHLTDIIEVMSIITLNILIPLIVEMKYGSMQGFISSEAVITFPISSPLLLAGIAEKRNLTANVLSSLPLLFIVLNYINTISSFANIPYILLGIASLIVASALFSLKRVISLTGVIFGLIGLSSLFYLTPLPSPIPSDLVHIMIVASVVNAAFAGLYELGIRKRIKEKLQDEISSIRKEIDDSIMSLGRIRSYAELGDNLSDIIAEDEKIILELSRKIDLCKSLECVSTIYNEFLSAKANIEDKISQYIFNTIVEYNNIAKELKKNGIILQEINVPSEKIRLIEDDVDKIQKILSTINKNISLGISEINSIIDSIEKISGTRLNRFYITEYSSILGAIEYLIKKNNVLGYANQCLSYDRDIMSILQFHGFESKKLEIVRKLNEYYGKEILLSDIRNIEVISNQVLALLNEYLNYIKIELEKIWNLTKLKNLKDKVDVLNELIHELNKKDEPILRKLSAAITFIFEISNAEKMVQDRENIYTLFTLLKENEDIIREKLYEERCIELEELGISSSFGVYVLEYLNDRNMKVRLSANKICLP